MIAIPSQRVQPTGAASGSKASQRSPWELRLSRGSFFVVSLLLGVIIVSAYYLGFVSGKAIGLEAALSGTVATLPKLPIIPPLEIPAEVVKDSSEASRSLDSAKPQSPQPTAALKKDEEGLQPIPRLNLELPEAEKPADKVGAKSGESASAQPIDPLEKVLDDRAASLKLTPTAIAEARDGEGDSKPGSKFLKEGTVPRGWYVQAAAVTTEDEANSAAEKLVSSGFPVVIEDVKIGKKQYYRILVGPESEREPALRMVEQVKRERLLKGDPFLRRSK